MGLETILGVTLGALTAGKFAYDVRTNDIKENKAEEAAAVEQKKAADEEATLKEQQSQEQAIADRDEMRRRQVARAARAGGRRSTLLTGSLGLPDSGAQGAPLKTALGA